MKSIHALVCILVLLHVSSAYSGLDPEPDKMGIYFDLESYSHYSIEYGEYIMVPAYIVLSNPTFPEIHRWEATLGGTEYTFLYEVEFEGGDVNYGSDTEYHVLYETPLACEPVTLLATVNFFFLPDFHCSCLYLTSTSNPSLPGGLPVVWPEEGSPVAIQPTSMFENGVGALLGDSSIVIGYPHPCETLVEIKSYDWGTIKALFR